MSIADIRLWSLPRYAGALLDKVYRQFPRALPLPQTAMDALAAQASKMGATFE